MRAFPNPTQDFLKITPDILSEGLTASRESPRKRMIFPMHRNQGDPVQRILNFLQPGTYIPPHNHPLPGATETVMVLSGALTFIRFSSDGNILEHLLLKPQSSTCLIDIVEGLWHGFVVEEPDTVILEIKKGPYDPEADKTFAPWAPEEDSQAAAQYLESLMSKLSVQQR